ncbi:MAG: rhomboid family intramembrane serine protease [Lysobacterales bacterium]|jgi:membrane associated rhomboid family serine protease
MALQTPDPRYTHSKRARSNFRLSMRIALVLIGIIWTVFIIDSAFGLRLARFGLRPGSVEGLLGVFTAPLLHANFQHILSNTLPLFISLVAVLYLFPNSALRVVPATWLGSGLLAWFFARPSLHIGASGMVYGLLAFVFFSGLLKRDMRSISVSLLIAFLYGSMVWGILPTRPQMSWETHLAGAVVGVMMAIVYRHWDRVPVKRYDWEDDDSIPDWFPDDKE